MRKPEMILRSINLPPDLDSAVDRIAVRRNTTRSEVMRSLLAKGVDQDERIGTNGHVWDKSNKWDLTCIVCGWNVVGEESLNGGFAGISLLDKLTFTGASEIPDLSKIQPAYSEALPVCGASYLDQEASYYRLRSLHGQMYLGGWPIKLDDRERDELVSLSRTSGSPSQGFFPKIQLEPGLRKEGISRVVLGRDKQGQGRVRVYDLLGGNRDYSSILFFILETEFSSAWCRAHSRGHSYIFVGDKYYCMVCSHVVVVDPLIVEGHAITEPDEHELIVTRMHQASFSTDREVVPIRKGIWPVCSRGHGSSVLICNPDLLRPVPRPSHLTSPLFILKRGVQTVRITDSETEAITMIASGHAEGYEEMHSLSESELNPFHSLFEATHRIYHSIPAMIHLLVHGVSPNLPRELRRSLADFKALQLITQQELLQNWM